MEKDLRKKIVITASDSEKAGDILMNIHSQLAGHKDYVNSNIVLNDSGTRCDGTENEIHVYIYKECENEPEITII